MLNAVLVRRQVSPDRDGKGQQVWLTAVRIAEDIVAVPETVLPEWTCCSHLQLVRA